MDMDLPAGYTGASGNLYGADLKSRTRTGPAEIRNPQFTVQIEKIEFKISAW